MDICCFLCYDKNAEGITALRKVKAMQDFLENRFNFILPDELNMYYCGKREKTLNHSYGPMVRNHFLLVFVMEGHAILELNDREIAFGAGEMLAIFPQENIYYHVNEGEHWTIKWVGVYGSLVYKYLESFGVTREYPILKVRKMNKVETILDEIFDASLSNLLSDQIRCIGQIHMIFSLLAKSVSNTELSHDWIVEAKQFMQNHYEDAITVSDVASSLSLERSYFSKRYKEITGISPGEHLMELRIKKAKKLLENTNVPIKSVSYSIGISDPLYFSRLFKEKVGFSPTEYRRHMTE